jgi:hypothetical protein
MHMRVYAWEANAIYMPDPDYDEDDALEWGWDEDCLAPSDWSRCLVPASSGSDLRCIDLTQKSRFCKCICKGSGR